MLRYEQLPSPKAQEILHSDHELSNLETLPLNKKPENGINVKLFLLTVLSAISGFLFGYDTGIVSGAMLFLRQEFRLTTLWQEVIVSSTIGTAAFFSLIAGLLNEFLGRKIIILVASVIFFVGSLMLGLAQSFNVLLIGRITVGAAIGLSSTTVSMYISECAPAQMRGKLIIHFQIFITFGMFAAALVAMLFSLDQVNGWRFMLGAAIIPAAFQTISFLFMPESPRWLVFHGRPAEARKVLQSIRKGTELHIDQELEDIQMRHHRAGGSLQKDKWGTVFKMFKDANTRRALFVGCGLQAFQQIIGINTVMYYCATIVRMSGVTDNVMVLGYAAAIAAVNFIFTFVGFYFVDRVGRRVLILASLSGVLCSLVIIAINFQIVAYQSPPISLIEVPPTSYNSSSKFCTSQSSCQSCVSATMCGFCFEHANQTQKVINGSCLPANPDFFEKNSEWGRCSLADSSQFNWAYDFCPTSLAWMTILGMILYLSFFASGMGPLPWIINAEIYPLWGRNCGLAFSTATNWLFNLLISLTFLTLTEQITRYGAFWLYSLFCVLAIAFVSFFLPETKGKSLEEIEDLW